jgi:hypothetical protein
MCCPAGQRIAGYQITADIQARNMAGDALAQGGSTSYDATILD